MKKSNPSDRSHPPQRRREPLFSFDRQGVELLAPVMKAGGAAVVLPSRETHLNPNGTVGEEWVCELRTAVRAYNRAKEKRRHPTLFPKIEVEAQSGGVIEWIEGRGRFWVGDHAYGAHFLESVAGDTLLFWMRRSGERQHGQFELNWIPKLMEAQALSPREQAWLAVVLPHFGWKTELVALKKGCDSLFGQGGRAPCYET